MRLLNFRRIVEKKLAKAITAFAGNGITVGEFKSFIQQAVDEEMKRVPCCGHDCCCRKVKEDEEKLLKGFRP